MARKRSHEEQLLDESDNDMDDDSNPLATWLDTPIYREERRYLETHPELLSAENNARLAALEQDRLAEADARLATLRPQIEALRGAHAAPLSDDLWEYLLDYSELMEEVDEFVKCRRLLDDIRNRGGDIQAIRDAYVNARGGLMLDIPTWLEEIEHHIDALELSESATETAVERATLLRTALAQVREDQDIAPETQAELQAMLSSALNDGVAMSTEPIAVQETVISALETALQVFTLERFPQQYAMAQNDLGNALQERIAGEKRENQERAIAAYQQALLVRTLDRFPLQYAITQNDLGNVLRERIAGEKRENQERAIAAFEQALLVYTLERFPQDYATTQNNLGNVLHERIAGTKRDNQERAIAAFEQALLVYTLERFPQQYATTQNNLGNALQERIAGEKRENQERAIAAYQQALLVYTLDHLPQGYAMTQNNLGVAWSERIAGTKRDNQERAIAAFDQALLVYTLDHLPHDYASTQNNLGRVQADYGNWAQAATAWEAALDAQDILLALSGSVAGRDATLRDGEGAATHAAYARIRSGDSLKAALAIERGRARGLAETQRMQAGAPERISDPGRRARYSEARAALSQAQIALNLPITGAELEQALAADRLAPGWPSQIQETQSQALETATRNVELARAETFRQAKAVFDTVVAEVRAVGDPADFLLAPLDLAALRRAAARGGAGHALVYLGATKWGGMALGIFTANPTDSAHVRIETLDLPMLTFATVFDLIERPIAPDDERLIGGYLWAQENSGLGLLLRDWSGETLRERAHALHTACHQKGVYSALTDAIQRTMLTMQAYPAYAHLPDTPLVTLSMPEHKREVAILNSSVNHHFLRDELARSLTTLADSALRDFAAWLQENGATSVTLIPCGELAAFPLTAAEIAPGVTFGDRFPTSIAPSARSLLRDEAAHARARERRRAGVATLGDPRVTHQPLQWGEAEALTVAKLACQLGLPADSRAQWQAERDWLLARLTDTLLVDASCHGFFNAREPLDSLLALAGTERPTPLTLRELLNQGIEGQGLLLGLRLLVLSACQTGILDLRGATDEMRSLTAGVLEAGADAAMGALWSVDDKATYLLIVRFAQLWLPHMDTMPPAHALAQAQHWLRTVTNRELRAWRADNFPEPTVEEKRAAGCSEPELDPWREEAVEAAAQPAGAARLIAVRGPGDRLAEPDEGEWTASGADTRGERQERQERYDPETAQDEMRVWARRTVRGDACPYAHPYYWAAFQITGW